MERTAEKEVVKGATKPVVMIHRESAGEISLSPLPFTALPLPFFSKSSFRLHREGVREETWDRGGRRMERLRFYKGWTCKAWDCSAWVRTYALFLEERLECFRVLKYDIEAERLMRNAQGAPKPEGVGCGNYLIQYALALFFDMSKYDAIKALEIYKRAGQQAESLSNFYDFCKHLDLARNFQFPTLRQPPPSFLATMEEYVREAPRFASTSKKEHNKLLVAIKIVRPLLVLSSFATFKGFPMPEFKELLHVLVTWFAIREKNMLRKSALDMPDVPLGHLPEHLELQRTRVLCKADAPSHTEGVEYSGAYAAMGFENTLQLDSFCRDFRVEIKRLTKDAIEFDLVGIDASLANAFRRILIAEVPTMAIEKVFIVNNTSVMADEVLSHRLGLLPVDADPRLFDYLSENDVPNERNTIVFKLDVHCKKGCPRLTVKSDQLQWLPNGSELLMESPNPPAKPKAFTSFSTSQASLPHFSGIGMKHNDIIINKLGPGQCIELEAHAVKGVGKVHAKWSPVGTAWYRMLPEVILLKELKGKDAENLVNRCPVGVFDIEDCGIGVKKALVSRPRDCTLCRECINAVVTVESTSALPPEVLFSEAVKILEEKCERVISELS
ncbi:hypothetical protein HPP92_020002 [Vanilla planifolia]|uniref:DNA-directed RNA polymerases I and III subunit RPAC1 n=1 Tax=Vanilla planifolia TaxID=51239 RepID=A0A835Q6U3_VANPL|nr:hypothetical protein HPP92_020002 [Vanilla planifolia]